SAELRARHSVELRAGHTHNVVRPAPAVGFDRVLHRLEQHPGSIGHSQWPGLRYQCRQGNELRPGELGDLAADIQPEPARQSHLLTRDAVGALPEWHYL